MDNRGYNAKSFGFTKEVISNNSRRIHPIDDENNAIPIHSIDNHSPSYTVSYSQQKNNQRRFPKNIIVTIIFILF